jgi:DNA (cytosine-5)-methyltransferase 1
MPKRTKRANPRRPAARPAVATAPARWSQPTLAQVLRVLEPAPALVALSRAGAGGAPDLNGESVDDNDARVRVVDLFSGIGGWSEGSRQAGHRVVLAVDFNEALLRIHAKNHPECAHLRMELGPKTEARLVEQVRRRVPEGCAWHLHASPPCTAISTMRGATRTRDVTEGMRLVLWYVALVLRLKPTTWSMEEVGTGMLDGILAMARHLHPEVVAFAPDVPLETYGVPQSRKRTLAGTPRLIERFLNDASLRAEAPVLSAVLPLPEGATIVKGAAGKCVDPKRTVVHADGSQTNDTPIRLMKSVHELCYTCLAGNPHYWCRPDFSTIRRFNTREQATLQCFPKEYRFGAVGDSIAGVGNAVPCLVARKFMEGV